MYGLVRASVVSALDMIISKDAYAYVLGRAYDLEEGVVCMTHEPSNYFKVELIMKIPTLVDMGERVLLAIAASMPDVCIDLRWTQCMCLQGKKYIATIALESPGRKLSPSRVANAIAIELVDVVDAKFAKNVEVVALTGNARRGQLFQKLVAYTQTHFGMSLDHPGEACTTTYIGRTSCVNHEWRIALDDAMGREPPFSIAGLDYARKLETAKESASVTQAALTANMPLTPLVKHLNKMKVQLKQEQGTSKAKTQNWVDTVESLRVAYENTSPPPKNIEDVENALNTAVYGMYDVKDAILGMASCILLNPLAIVRAIGFVGVPGCGKTSVATRGFAGLGRPVQVIDLGGAKKSSFLKGFDFTYEGSRPGRIVDALISAGCKDPVLVFDELDKVAGDSNGHEVLHVLMALIDPLQRHAFKDDYLNFELDLSRTIVVFTFNDESKVDPVLLDRMLVVRMPELTVEDRMSIVSTHILPRIGELGEGAMSVIENLAQNANSDEGMRGIEKVIERAAMHASVRAVKAINDVNATCAANAVCAAAFPSVLLIEKDDLQKATKFERKNKKIHLSMFS